MQRAEPPGIDVAIDDYNPLIATYSILNNCTETQAFINFNAAIPKRRCHAINMSRSQLATSRFLPVSVVASHARYGSFHTETNLRSSEGYDRTMLRDDMLHAVIASIFAAFLACGLAEKDLPGRSSQWTLATGGTGGADMAGGMAVDEHGRAFVTAKLLTPGSTPPYMYSGGASNTFEWSDGSTTGPLSTGLGLPPMNCTAS